jgi:dynein intermediate chain 1
MQANQQLVTTCRGLQYWDDPADTIRQHEGTLLPLWKFHADVGRGRHVTSLCWSPAYADMFAVGFGSYDSQRQGSGAVGCFSLKDPKTPVYQFTTRSGEAQSPAL